MQVSELDYLIEKYGELAATVRAVPTHNDLDAQACYLSDVAAVLGTINEFWANAESLVTAAKAVASEAYTGEKWKNASKKLIENLIDGQCRMELKVAMLYERLSRTAVHSIEAVRSLLSNSKMERAASQYHR